VVGIALPPRNPSDSGERSSADRTLSAGSGERVGESPSSLRKMRVREPEPPQGGGELELRVRVACSEPFECGAEVVVVGFKTLRAFGLRIHATRVALGGESLKCVRVPVPQLVGLAGSVELLGGVLPDRL
jgi:hypothetical protein